MMARLASKKLRDLASGSFEDYKQKKFKEDLCREENREEADKVGVIEIDESVGAAEGEVLLSRKKKVRVSFQAKKKMAEVMDKYTICSPPPLQWTLSVTATGEVVLESPPKLPQPSGGSSGRSYDLKRKLRELIRLSGARIPDDSVWNLSFIRL
ncbi:hypothetical protein Adt_31472 [Abeliophyllum distichum]|uniref:Uncharacterized protein n=1 Tax=Abeliophyllum distichum TaxID=126358 RepID=A0ABD1RFF9_9LAMI